MRVRLHYSAVSEYAVALFQFALVPCQATSLLTWQHATTAQMLLQAQSHSQASLRPLFLKQHISCAIHVACSLTVAFAGAEHEQLNNVAAFAHVFARAHTEPYTTQTMCHDTILGYNFVPVTACSADHHKQSGQAQRVLMLCRL